MFRLCLSVLLLVVSGALPSLGFAVPAIGAAHGQQPLVGRSSFSPGQTAALGLQSRHMAFAFPRAGARRAARGTASTMVELLPVIGGLEAGAAAIAGHVPGVAIGAAAVLWGTVVKDQVANIGSLRPVADVLGSALGFLTVTMLAVRAVTFVPEARYQDFPVDIAAPAGCTRVADGGNTRIKPPVFAASVEEVQGAAKAWIDSQPRSTVVNEQPGYIQAEFLSLLFGFPDSFGVKVFKNASGKTELWVQSELRVGGSDLGVNGKRVQAFLDSLQQDLNW